MNQVQNRKQLYRTCRQLCGLNKRQWGRLFALGSLNNTAQVVGHKENPAQPGPGNTSKGVNKAEALAAQLLLALTRLGYDLEAIQFDKSGKIISLPPALHLAPSLAQPADSPNVK